MKLRLEIKLDDEWDDVREKFITHPSKVINLEHSLYSISLWEEKYHKPFLNQERKKSLTVEELIDYIRFMSDQPIDDDIIILIAERYIDDIESYMSDPSTATKFRTFDDENGKKEEKKIVTSEMLYWQMFHYNIPLEFQHWHIQRLITLIRVCQDKEGDIEPLKMSREYRSKLNEARKKKYKSKG